AGVMLSDASMIGDLRHQSGTAAKSPVASARIKVTLAPSADGFMVITKVTPSARVSVISLAVHAMGSHNNRRARSERPQFCNSRFKVRKRLPSTPPPSTAIVANPATAASTHGAD